jgi:hypothetical protein
VLTNSGRRRIEAAFLVLPPIALISAMVGGVPIVWRSAVAAVFFLVSPGLAVLAPARFRWQLELAILVPTSLAMTSLVSSALFYAGVWTPMLAVVCLSALCAIGALGAAARDLRPPIGTHANTGRPVETAYTWGDVT